MSSPFFAFTRPFPRRASYLLNFMRPIPRRIRPLARAALWLATLLYLALLLYVVFFARRRAGLVWSPNLVNLVPLLTTIHRRHSIEAIGWGNYWMNILGNIALFVPLPILLASIARLRNRWQLLAIGVAASVLIEATQYVGRIGVPDIDDVILNGTGAALGVALWEVVFRRIHRRLAL